MNFARIPSPPAPAYHDALRFVEDVAKGDPTATDTYPGDDLAAMVRDVIAREPEPFWKKHYALYPDPRKSRKLALAVAGVFKPENRT
ncbi:MAG TPA: hypothetical protein VEA69_16830 [Tepidisphaeraceae bacterium]|nr:hypothetical protein [Tepidisphaeraceae bacterium]